MDYSYQGRHPPSQLTAMAAHTHGAIEHDMPWYLDSGANHHITLELENLTLQQPYQGIENVTVGNGGGLQIANTSSSLISTLNNLFCLNNIHIALIPHPIYCQYKNFVKTIIVTLYSLLLIL